MLHVASLIHDDLPCMDDDQSRRGKPSNHAVYGVDMAILAGDALFPLGFSHIVTETPSNLVPANRILQVVAEMARAVGSTGMAAGQFIELNAGSGKEMVELVEEKKFGEMAECSAVCGGILGGAKEEEVERLRRYGRAVGVLYQVVDEILEEKEKGMGRIEGEENRKGRNRVSYVGAFGLERAMEVAEELKKKAKRELEGFEIYQERVAPLYSFVDYAVERGFEVGVAGNGGFGDVRIEAASNGVCL
ncbi:heterodimeric geranylgeranyl pyrophosphate synthase small subunit, chloroplastic-like [Tasmannia lanceolata]|uniref:heterodimeric geranylgeranyl pyrophosphate synthase small subunit, chloroplastic-like n=1 Tax=Tasmannia lanceolata TaxID=3420 RepID=UPI0040644D09